jgi:hypothetical protein
MAGKLTKQLNHIEIKNYAQYVVLVIIGIFDEGWVLAH